MWFGHLLAPVCLDFRHSPQSLGLVRTRGSISEVSKRLTVGDKASKMLRAPNTVCAVLAVLISVDSCPQLPHRLKRIGS